MKKSILILLVFFAGFAQAQSLKETLYRGKLKNEPGTVIRKGDDLSAKIDTVHKTASTDSSLKTATTLISDSAKKGNLHTEVTGVTNQTNVAANADTMAEITDKPAVAVKDNNVLWKDYITAVTNTLNAEVLPSKKIKRGNYYVSVSYAIGTDGQVTINNVLLTPENSFLQQQIKDRITVDTPKLNPVLASNGAPRKVNKNYNFTITKE